MATDSIRYCAGCMTISEAGRCTNANCRWDDHAHVETQEHLPLHYILVDRYYVGRVLGQGGFGVTYIAHDLKLDRTVAIKEFLPKDQCSRRTDHITVHSFSEEKGDQFRYGLQRFLSEARNVAKHGGHPNLVSVTDFVEANGTAYMVMDFIAGVTLKQYLASQGGRIPYTVAIEIVLHVMAALNKAHEHGLIHRDVSPDNIMLSSVGPVKLIDFGAARQAVGEKSQNLTMVLKPGYAPEEQYRSRGVQGPWTDVYATAATLYRCITGEVPPPAVDRLVEDELAPPSKLCADLPPAVEAVLRRALSIRAADRYQTIREFRQALITALPATSTRPEPVTSTPAQPDEQKRTPTVLIPEPESRSFAAKSLAPAPGALPGASSLAWSALVVAITYLCWLLLSIGRSMDLVYTMQRFSFGLLLTVIPGMLLYFAFYRVSLRKAKNGFLRWSVAVFLFAMLVGQTIFLVQVWDRYYRVTVEKNTIVTITASLFLIPVVFAIRNRGVRLTLSIVSFLAVAYWLINVLIVLFRYWDPADPIFIVSYISKLIFLAFSFRFGLPDELVQRDTGANAETIQSS